MGWLVRLQPHAGPARDAKKLIRAAVEAANHGSPPPPELVLAWRCERWQSLPDAGGLLDQDARRMRIMTQLLNVYAVRDKLNNAQGKQIHSLTTSERRLIRWLMDNGLM